MREALLAGTLVLGLMTVAAPASAGTLAVQYHISDGSIPGLIDPSTNIDGMLTVAYTALASPPPYTKIDGAAGLVSFFVTLSDATIATDAVLAWAVVLDFFTAGSGYRESDNFYGWGTVVAGYYSHCTGANCSGIFGQPASAVYSRDPYNWGFYLTLPGSGSAAIISGAFHLTGSQYAPFQFIGSEVGRTFVPEPGALHLLGLGAFALLGGAAWGARRRPR